CDPPAGSTFPLGTTKVTCTAIDKAGNKSCQSFNITVVDTTAPAFSNIPQNITKEGDVQGGAIVNYVMPSAADLVDGAVTPTASSVCASIFPVGTTTVTFTATASHGNTGVASFTVTVTDTQAPTFSSAVADMYVEATGPNGATVTYVKPTASDIVDGN